MLLNPGDSISDFFKDAVAFYVIFGSFAFIPFWLIAWPAKRLVTKDEFNIYQIRGALAGLSVLTFVYFFGIAVDAKMAHQDPPGASQAAAILMGIALFVGFAIALIGWVIGFAYGKIRKHQRETKDLNWHPKNLWY